MSGYPWLLKWPRPTLPIMSRLQRWLKSCHEVYGSCWETSITMIKPWRNNATGAVVRWWLPSPARTILIPIMMMEWRYERFYTRHAQLPSKTSMNISKLFLMFIVLCLQKDWSQPSSLSSALFSSINWQSSILFCWIRLCASDSKLCSKPLKIYVHASITWKNAIWKGGFFVDFLNLPIYIMSGCK